jgi:hypothetical protein
MIVVATLLCDAKRRDEMTGLPAMLNVRGDCNFYVNYETHDSGTWWASRQKVVASGRPYAFDFWQRESTWHARARADQDSSRLEPICIARNMARAYAISMGASHLLFVDADVVVNADGLERLLELNTPLCGGYVPGRGVHNTGHYVFGQKHKDGHLIYCAHGTLGYCLIRRDLFEVIPIRWGAHPSPEHRGVMLSEDPAFAADAERYYGATWVIDTRITAQHIGELDEVNAREGGHL